MSVKYVLVIQCDKARQRCSGFHCAHAFYERIGHFTEYGPDVRYLSFTCGGCNGKMLNSLIMHLARKAKDKENLEKDDIAVHFASCVTYDNWHSPRCMFLPHMREIVERMGFKNVELGSYICKMSQDRREAGVYKTYDD